MVTRLSPHIVVELRAENMLYMLEHGFVPKRDEVFIDALFRQHKDLTAPQKTRFKKYIEAHGTNSEKSRAKDLD